MRAVTPAPAAALAAAIRASVAFDIVTEGTDVVGKFKERVEMRRT